MLSQRAFWMIALYVNGYRRRSTPAYYTYAYIYVIRIHMLQCVCQMPDSFSCITYVFCRRGFRAKILALRLRFDSWYISYIFTLYMFHLYVKTASVVCCTVCTYNGDRAYWRHSHAYTCFTITHRRIITHTHIHAENCVYKAIGFLLEWEKNSHIATTTWNSQRWLDKCAKSGYSIIHIGKMFSTYFECAYRLFICFSLFFLCVAAELWKRDSKQAKE